MSIIFHKMSCMHEKVLDGKTARGRFFGFQGHDSPEETLQAAAAITGAPLKHWRSRRARRFMAPLARLATRFLPEALATSRMVVSSA